MSDYTLIHWTDRDAAYRDGRYWMAPSEAGRIDVRTVEAAAEATGCPFSEVWIEELLGEESAPAALESFLGRYTVGDDGLARRNPVVTATLPAAGGPPEEAPYPYCVVSWHDRDAGYVGGSLIGVGDAAVESVARLAKHSVSPGEPSPFANLYVQEFLNDRSAPGTMKAFLAEFRIGEDGITALRVAELPPAEMEYRTTRSESKSEAEARENKEQYGSAEQRDPSMPDVLLVKAESPGYGELRATVEKADYGAWSRLRGLDVEGVLVSLVTVGDGEVLAVKPGLAGEEALREWQGRMLKDGFSIADHERTYDAIPPFFRKAAYGFEVPGGGEQESLMAFWLNWLEAPFEPVESGCYLVPEEPVAKFGATPGPHAYGDAVQCDWCDGTGFLFRRRSWSSMYGSGTGFEQCSRCGGEGHVPSSHTGDPGLDEELATFGNHMREGIWFGAFEAGEQEDFDLVAYRFHAAGPQGGPVPPEGHHPDSLAFAEMLERELGPRGWLTGESRTELLQELDEWFGGREEMLREYPGVYSRGREA